MTILLTTALAITQLLDWYSTRMIMNRGGYEQNNVMAELFRCFGVDRVLCVKAVAVTGAGYLIASASLSVLGAVVVFYVAILIHNWKSMPRN